MTVVTYFAAYANVEVKLEMANLPMHLLICIWEAACTVQAMQLNAARTANQDDVMQIIVLAFKSRASYCCSLDVQ